MFYLTFGTDCDIIHLYNACNTEIFRIGVKLLVATIYCPQCGGEIPEKETICPSCGFDLDTYEEKDADEQQTEEFNEILDAANKRLSEENASNPSAKTDDEPISELPEGAKKVTADVSENNGSAKAPDDKKEVSEESKTQEETEVPKAEPKKKKREKKKISPAFITFLAVIVAGALGFCAAVLVFGDMFKTEEESFAIRAANAVNSKLNVNEKLCVYKAYVRSGSGEEECLLYAVIDYDDTVTVSKYRVVVDKTSPDVINIYYTLDENDPDYIAMKNSDDPKTRIQASLLKNYSDSIEEANREIQIGSPSWKQIDISKINSAITSEQVRTTASK